MQEDDSFWGIESGDDTLQQIEECWFACGKPMEEYEEVEKFTNTSDYNYLVAFLGGLNLVARMSSATLCQDALIFTTDDYTNTENNLTLELQHTNISTFKPIMPLLSVTKLLGTNFADAFPYCWATTDEFIDYVMNLYEGSQRDFNKLLISYLFTQMGYAQNYHRIMSKIEENNEKQNFEANYAQYGQIIS